MTEQELIDTINALIDADVQGECPALRPKDIARRAIDQCGGDAFATEEAVTDLVQQIFIARCEPWQLPPGARPHLREWKDGVVPLAPKPSVMEMLEAGRRGGDPIAVTLARVRGAYPELTEAEMEAEIDAYMAWLRACAEEVAARVRDLEKRGTPL